MIDVRFLGAAARWPEPSKQIVKKLPNDEDELLLLLDQISF